MRITRARRAALGVVASLTLVPLVACGQDKPADAAAATSAGAEVSKTAAKQPTGAFQALERKFDAKLGVYAIDTGTGREVTHHADQRFAYNSTFKALQAGAVLDKFSVKGLDKRVRYDKDDLVPNSPVTEKHVDTGMTVGELSAAAVRQSDNTAANLLFDQLGGPKALDAVLERKLGDKVTRMERPEPLLSTWVPGEKRDTTTARAFTENLRQYVLGDALGKPERARLKKWMLTNETGDELIKAGMPKGWKVADKSGAGQFHGARNDIAVVWPKDSAPLVMSIMSYRPAKDADYDNKLIAEAASVVADELS